MRSSKSCLVIRQVQSYSRIPETLGGGAEGEALNFNVLLIINFDLYSSIINFSYITYMHPCFYTPTCRKTNTYKSRSTGFTEHRSH